MCISLAAGIYRSTKQKAAAAVKLLMDSRKKRRGFTSESRTKRTGLWDPSTPNGKCKLKKAFPTYVGYNEVMFTTELLELILSFVDEGTLLLAQRVCGYWHNLITSSHMLQCKLFFKQPALRTWTNLTPNPFLGLVFYKWRVNIENQTTTLEHRSKEYESKVLASWHVLAIRWEGYKEHHSRQAYEGLPDVDTWSSPLADGPICHPRASWRRMFACQPASGSPLDHPSIDTLEPDDPWMPLIQPWPVLTDFAGADAGPWPIAYFKAMLPFLNAESMALNAARMLYGTSERATAQMRVSWGPLTVTTPTPVDMDTFMFQPGGPTARMMSSNARARGVFLREGQDVVFSRVEGFSMGRSSHRVLDLASQMTWFVNYWPHADHLAWRATALGPAKGAGLGRVRIENIPASPARDAHMWTLSSDGP
ncbi:hypothetical protein ACHAQA_002448 [Verticillium albo-atrum]